MPTLGLDFATEKYQSTMNELKGETYNMKVWDTAGMERFKTLTYSFYKRADGILVGYSVTDRRSFENIQNWITAIEQYAQKNIPIIVVGTKIDLESERVVHKEEA